MFLFSSSHQAERNQCTQWQCDGYLVNRGQAGSCCCCFVFGCVAPSCRTNKLFKSPPFSSNERRWKINICLWIFSTCHSVVRSSKCRVSSSSSWIVKWTDERTESLKFLVWRLWEALVKKIHKLSGLSMPWRGVAQMLNRFIPSLHRRWKSFAKKTWWMPSTGPRNDRPRRLALRCIDLLLLPTLLLLLVSCGIIWNYRWTSSGFIFRCVRSRRRRGDIEKDQNDVDMVEIIQRPQHSPGALLSNNNNNVHIKADVASASIFYLEKIKQRPPWPKGIYFIFFFFSIWAELWALALRIESLFFFLSTTVRVVEGIY